MAGQEHLDTLNVMGNLASLDLKLGRYDEAESLYSRTLTLLEITIGPAHSTALHAVISLYRHQGNLWNSEQMFKRALRGYQKAWGSEHVSTIAAVNNLGNLYAD